MRRLFIYDTETSGFPNGKYSPGEPKQAWICQLGGRLINEVGDTLLTVNVLQQTYGREIGKIPLGIHKKTPAMCDRFGLDKDSIYDTLLAIFKLTDIAICHNVNFDGKMLGLFAASFKSTELLDQLNATPSFCTMAATTKLCGLTQKNGYTPKWPKLEELHKFLFNGDEFANAHDAMADVDATYRCFGHEKVQEIFQAKHG